MLPPPPLPGACLTPWMMPAGAPPTGVSNASEGRGRPVLTELAVFYSREENMSRLSNHHPLRTAQKAEEKSTAPTPIKPLRPLGDAGLAVWKRFTREYELTGGAAVEIVQLACEAIDRAEACAAQIATDGLMISDNRGRRDNPLLKAELAARAFAARALHRL